MTHTKIALYNGAPQTESFQVSVILFKNHKPAKKELRKIAKENNFESFCQIPVKTSNLRSEISLAVYTKVKIDIENDYQKRIS